jgi:hypothetical protein
MSQHEVMLPYQNLVEEKDRELFKELSIEVFSELVKKMNEAEKLSVEDMIKELNLDPFFVIKVKKPPIVRRLDEKDLYHMAAGAYIGLKKFVKERYDNIDAKLSYNTCEGCGFPTLHIEYAIKGLGGFICPTERHGLQEDSFLFAYMEINGIAKRKTKQIRYRGS